jgi:hypothetical protein
MRSQDRQARSAAEAHVLDVSAREYRNRVVCGGCIHRGLNAGGCGAHREKKLALGRVDVGGIEHASTEVSTSNVVDDLIRNGERVRFGGRVGERDAVEIVVLRRIAGRVDGIQVVPKLR